MATGPSGETIDTPRHRALGSASRVTILRLIRASDSGLTGADVVEHTGLHPSTVRAHLERLVEARLLVRARANGGTPGRPAWRYQAATPDPAPAPYRPLAAALLEHLATTGGGTVAAREAGQAWGRRLATTATPGEPVRATLDVLRHLGFDPHAIPTTDAPEPGTDGAGAGEVEVHLHVCPFLELVGQHPDVMCALHAGMVSGVLHAAGAADGQAVLEPFAAPTACVVRIQAPTPRP
jgi:predicted ArsR family transcriptional regulator